MAEARTIAVGGKTLPVGTHYIKEVYGGYLPDRELSVSGTQQAPICQSTYTTRLGMLGMGDQIEWRVEDRGCNGVDRIFWKWYPRSTRQDGQPTQVSQRWRQLSLNKRANGILSEYGYDPQGFFAQAHDYMQRAIDRVAIKPVIEGPTPDAPSWGGGYGEEIKPISPRPPHGLLGLLEPTQTRNDTVYFDTAEYRLTEDAMANIRAFVGSHDGHPITIEGHCDMRGSASYNFRLGLQRARAVRDYLAQQFRGAAKALPKMAVVSFGEEGTNSTVRDEDRRTEIVIQNTQVRRALTALPADYYLVDASRSMNENWGEVKIFSFPHGARVFSFNTCTGVAKGVAQLPQCGTPLWSSTYQLLERMPRGKRLTVLSDGEENSSRGVGVEGIIQLARWKKIRISTIYVGAPNEMLSASLARIASETGGKFYLNAE